jgi:sulfur-carrier protein
LSVSVRIPAPLRGLTGNQDSVSASGGNLGECIDNLESQYPGIKERLYDESGELRRFINIYVNGEDIRFLSGMQTPVKDGDELSIVPAVAGG